MSAFKKIVLKSTTVMSLNERFTYLRDNRDNTVRAIRETTALQHQASARNRRLAQQMERRPAVMAALKLKKWSVRQRLGQPPRSTVKDRLTLPSNIYTPSRGRGRGRASLRGRGVSFSRGVRGSRFNRGSIIPQRGNLSGARTSFRRPGRSMRNIGGMRVGGRRGGPRGGSRGARGGPRGGSRGGGPRGSSRGRQQKLPSKEELDLQLDQYMANTKSHLDKELDSYMNQAPAENWD